MFIYVVCIVLGYMLAYLYPWRSPQENIVLALHFSIHIFSAFMNKNTFYGSLDDLEIIINSLYEIWIFPGPGFSTLLHLDCFRKAAVKLGKNRGSNLWQFYKNFCDKINFRDWILS